MVDTLLALANDYHAAWESLNPDAIVEYHGPGFEYYWFDERIAEGFKEILEASWLAQTREYSIEMLEPSVDLLGSGAAILSFRFNDSQVYESGDVVTTQGALGYVFERREGGWMIVRIHHSGPVPEEYR